MNGDETGIDAGGSCPSCSSCPDLTAIISFPDTIVCPGGNFGYDIRPVGGRAPYQMVFEDPFGDRRTVTGSISGGFAVETGDYTVRVVSVTDADGCMATPANLPVATVSTAPGLELILLEAIDPSCGVSDGGVVRVVARGGTSPYSLSAAEGDIFITDSVLTVTNLAAGSYDFRVTDAINCGAVTFSATLSDEPVFLSCPGDLRDTIPADVDTLSLNVPLPEIIGCPPGAVAYTITGATTANGSGPVGVQNFNVGSSTVTYFLGTESCSIAVNIEQLERPACSALSLRNVEVVSPRCGENNGSIGFDLVGFTNDFAFIWSSGDEELNLTNLSPGLYLFRVEEVQTGCRFSIGFRLQQSSPVNLVCASTPASDNSLADGSLLLSVTALAYPATMTYAGPLSGTITIDETASDTVVIDGLLAGNYALNVTDANGCNASCSTTILSACADASFGPTLEATVCAGQRFEWRGGSYTEAGTYPDTLQATAGCDSILTLQLTIDNPLPVFSFCPPDQEVILNLGSQSSLDLTWPAPVASSSCGDDFFGFIDVDSISGVTQDTTITYTATTAGGQSATCSFTIGVIRTDTMTFYVAEERLRRMGEDTVMVPIGVVNFDRGAAFQLHFAVEDMDGAGRFLDGVNPLHPLLESGLDFEVVDDQTLNLVWSTSNPQPNTFPDSTLLLEIPLLLTGEPGSCARLAFVENLPEVTMAFRLGEEVFPTTVGGNLCLPALADIGGTIFRLDPAFTRRPVPNVEVSLYEPDDQITRLNTPPNGSFLYPDRLREQIYVIEPFLDRDYLNGVSILDVVLIRNMLTGTINLSSPTTPYQFIAANIQANDCRISVSDLFFEMRLLAGIFPTFPTVNSYRFVDARHEFPTVAEIRAGNQEWCIFPETITIDPLGEDSLNNDFIAIKMGDVSLNARDPLPAGSRKVSISSQSFGAGDTVRVSPRFAEDLVAADLRWSFNPQVLRPITTRNQVKEAFGPGELIGWSAGEATQVWTDQTGRAELAFVATTRGNLTDNLSLAAASLGANDSAELFSLVLSTGVVEASALLWVSAVPNPFNDEVAISIISPVAASADLVVFDLAGRVLAYKTTDLIQGSQSINLQTHNWPAGIYHLRLTSSSGDYWLRLVKH